MITKIEYDEVAGHYKVDQSDWYPSFLVKTLGKWAFSPARETPYFTWQELQIIVDKLRELNQVGASHE